MKRRENEKEPDTQMIAQTALMMALILVGTIILRIPVPLGQGYVHLGDAMIYCGVLLLGRRNGTIAAGLGSAMADILGGFAAWAPWSLVIKAGMAFITGSLIGAAEKDRGRRRFDEIAAMAAGGLFMAAGYYAAEAVMYGNPAAALAGIPWNTGQFIAGIIISLMLQGPLERAFR